MRRAAPLALDEDFRFRDEGARRCGDVVAPGPDDDRDRACAGVAQRGERVGDHRPAGDRVQRLGDRRAHAHALAGGEDDAEAGSGGRGRGIHGWLLARTPRRAKRPGASPCAYQALDEQSKIPVADSPE